MTDQIKYSGRDSANPTQTKEIYLDVVNGAVPVTTMPGGTEYILEQDALSTAVTFDWTSIAPNGIKAISFKFSMEAATTPDINSIAGIAAPNSDAFRDAALTAGTSLAAAVARITHRVKDGQLDLIFTTPIYKFGMKRDLGSDALRVTAIGIGA